MPDRIHLPASTLDRLTAELLPLEILPPKVLLPVLVPPSLSVWAVVEVTSRSVLMVRVPLAAPLARIWCPLPGVAPVEAISMTRLLSVRAERPLYWNTEPSAWVIELATKAMRPLAVALSAKLLNWKR